MTYKTVLLPMIFSIFVCGSALAVDRTQFADSSESVTPILDGSKIPNANVALADGTPVSLQGLVMQKPSIVLFYRGGWCPYCNRQLAGLKSIEKELVDLGYQVLAISPESPERLQQQKLETEFAVTLISDKNLEAIQGFGVGFTLDDATTSRYSERGFNLTLNSNGKAVLPAPAIFIVDKAGSVNFSYVNPNYRQRPSETLILAAAKALK